MEVLAIVGQVQVCHGHQALAAFQNNWGWGTQESLRPGVASPTKLWLKRMCQPTFLEPRFEQQTCTAHQLLPQETHAADTANGLNPCFSELIDICMKALPLMHFPTLIYLHVGLHVADEPYSYNIAKPECCA